MKNNTVELVKFQRLQRKLKISKRETVGILELLWHATAKNAPAGDIGRLADDEIAILCDWPGESLELIQSLLGCGWLELHSIHRLIVHDWPDHAPSFVKGNMAKHNRVFVSSEQVAKQAANEGAKQAANEAAKQGSSPTVQPCYLSYPNLSNPILSSAGLEWPIKGGGTWTPTDEMVQTWVDAYTSIDVVAELKKSISWCKSNPSKQKTANGTGKFVNGWLGRAKSDSASEQGSVKHELVVTKSLPKPPPPFHEMRA